MHVEQAHQGNLALGAPREQRGQTVIVALLDGVEFVIVTARAPHRESKKCRPHRIDGVSFPLRPKLVSIISELDRKRAERKQARADAPVDVLLFLLRQLERSFQIHTGGP